MLNRTALTVFLYASFLYFLKRIVFVKRHVWFFRIYLGHTLPKEPVVYIERPCCFFKIPCCFTGKILLFFENNRIFFTCI